MSKSSKAPGNAYCVFMDVQRHTCIRVNADSSGVRFIPWDTALLDVKSLSHREFEMLYTMELTDYPVKKAAESYVTGSIYVAATAEAKKHLVHLTGGKFKDTATQPQFYDKESIMTAEAQAAEEKKAKKVSAPKAEPEAKKAAAKKGAEKPAKAAAKKVAAPKAEGERSVRTSKESGKKIKVLIKSPEVRPGSNRENQFKAVLANKTTDDAAVALREFTDKPWDVIRVMVAQGIIELV